MESLVKVIQFISPALGIIAFIGTYLIIISNAKKNEIRHTITKGNHTEGTVIEMNTKNENGIQKHAPVVEFHTANGYFHHKSNTYQNPSPYSIGKKVKIYYYIYKSRYEFALEDDTPGTLPGVLLKWGIIFCIVGYPAVFMRLLKLI